MCVEGKLKKCKGHSLVSMGGDGAHKRHLRWLEKFEKANKTSLKGLRLTVRLERGD